MSPMELDNLAFFGVQALVSPVHDGFPGTNAGNIEAYWNYLVDEVVPRVRGAGISGYIAVGIPPRKIPWQGLERLLTRMPNWLGLPEVVAVGGVGLHDGTEWEEDVLLRQAVLARDLRVPLIVTMPSRGGGPLLRRKLALMRKCEMPEGMVLFTGVTCPDASAVRSCGYRVAMGAMSARDASLMVARFGPEGLLLSSDLGHERPDPIVPARMVAAMEAEGLSRGVIRRVVFENAASFFGKSI